MRSQRRCVIDHHMRTLQGINTRRRSPEGWVPLPLLIRALEEGQRIALDVGGQRYIVGHAVRHSARWWLVPDWRTDAANLRFYEDS